MVCDNNNDRAFDALFPSSIHPSIPPPPSPLPNNIYIHTNEANGIDGKG